MSTTARLRASELLKVAVARLLDAIGWVGILGIVLAALAAGMLTWARTQQPRPLPPAPPPVPAPLEMPAPPPAAAMPPLPTMADTPTLLGQMQDLMRTKGLPWTQAEYRATPLSPDALATFTIHTALKGPYPQVRSVLTALLDSQPALALEALSITRINADVAEVEAKVAFVLYMGDGWTGVETRP